MWTQPWYGMCIIIQLFIYKHANILRPFKITGICMHTCTGPQGYSTLAERVVDIIGENKAIVYVDFVKDVSPLCIALEMHGCSNSAYHGTNMSTSDKSR